MDAPEFDAERARRKRLRIVSIICAVLILGFLAYQFRFWPERRLADKFFTALQKQDFETAYGIYTADPAWKQHPEKHAMYPYNEFYRDWGPGGEWGPIKNYHDLCDGRMSQGRERRDRRRRDQQPRRARAVVRREVGQDV